MSVIKFELKDDHLSLIKHLRFSMDESNTITTADQYSPFGGNNLYEDIDVILNGNVEPVGLFDTQKELSDDTTEKYKDLYEGLPHALEIVLGLQTTDVGTYRRKYHERGNWKKI